MLRKVIFWSHLILGISAGLVILIMSATGVLLTYEKQMLAWIDRDYLTEGSTLGAPQTKVEQLVATVRTASNAAPTTMTFYAGTSTVSAAADGTTYYVDGHTGNLLGTGSTQARAFFRKVTEWHRYIAMSGESRPTGKAITGAANLVFLVILVSGAVIWWRGAVLWFRRGLKGKALYWNWHNVFGVWMSIPMFLVVLSATVISYPWASNLVYTLTGSEPPAQVGGARGANGANARASNTTAPRGESPAGQVASNADTDLSTVNAALSNVQTLNPSWRTIAVRLPGPRDPEMTFTVDRANAGQPQYRSTVVADRKTGAIKKTEAFADQNLGRRARSWLRFIHTGEYYGIAGQTIAGIASFAGVALVLTGFVLSAQRFAAWVRRRGSRRTPTTAEVPAMNSTELVERG